MSLDDDLPTHSNTLPIGPETAGTEKLEAATRELGSLCSCWWTGTTDTEEGKKNLFKCYGSVRTTHFDHPTHNKKKTTTQYLKYTSFNMLLLIHSCSAVQFIESLLQYDTFNCILYEVV